jgi:enolase-phosphatase E1
VTDTRSRRAVRAVLLDVEGTTTPIAFVYGTLFPYTRAHLRPFLDDHGSTCAALLDRLRREQAADADAPADASVAEYVEWLIDRDRKSTALKELQGLIWEDGYRTGDLVGEVFPDVAPLLERWKRRGIDVGIFSSGSVLAQQLLFGHSSDGDLRPFLRWHFDTTTGSKTALESYRRIVDTIGLPPDAVLFVSDVVTELDAARAAGLQTALALRPGNALVTDAREHAAIRGLADLEISRP